jgi:uridine kinase
VSVPAGDVPGIAGDLAVGLARRLGPGVAAPSPGHRPACSRPGFVGVDGWSGSGKTTLALALAGELGAVVVHLDDLVAGWDDLAGSLTRLVEVVLPALAAGNRACWRSWDWAAGTWGAQRSQAPAALVVVEGCGAGSARVRPWLSALVWIEAAPEVRAIRLRGRSDWDDYHPWLAVWEAQERALRAGDHPRVFADALVVDDGTACALSWRDGA